MAVHTNSQLISAGMWEIVRVERKTIEGEPVGLYLTGVGNDLKGEDILTVSEALELRDYINKHLGGEILPQPDLNPVLDN